MSKDIYPNDPCSCGSGKKFKKCCLDNLQKGVLKPKDYFRIKGKNAEEIVYDLAKSTFFVDWCFKNPVLPNGKELCDLLIVFDNIVIIWQIKNLKVDDKTGIYSEKEIEKNLRQLSGARRQLFKLKTPVELENIRRKKELFDPNKIEKCFLISAMMGDEEICCPLDMKIKDYYVHVFSKRFIEIILNELDTISDFVDYLSAKEMIEDDKEIIIMGGEEELLAHYIMNNHPCSDKKIIQHDLAKKWPIYSLKTLKE